MNNSFNYDCLVPGAKLEQNNGEPVIRVPFDEELLKKCLECLACQNGLIDHMIRNNSDINTLRCALTGGGKSIITTIDQPLNGQPIIHTNIKLRSITTPQPINTIL